MFIQILIIESPRKISISLFIVHSGKLVTTTVKSESYSLRPIPDIRRGPFIWWSGNVAGERQWERERERASHVWREKRSVKSELVCIFSISFYKAPFL